MPKKKAGAFDDLLDDTARRIREGELSLDEFLEEPPPPRQKAIGVQIFWTVFLCACGAKHGAPTYGAAPLLKLLIEKPRMIGGKHYGWRFYAVEYVPMVVANMYPELPRTIQTNTVRILQCPSCVSDEVFTEWWQ